MSKQRGRVIVLELDPDDERAVLAAMSRRSDAPIPDGGGNCSGKLIAEICRGWMEMLDLRTPRAGEWLTKESP